MGIGTSNIGHSYIGTGAGAANIGHSYTGIGIGVTRDNFVTPLVQNPVPEYSTALILLATTRS